MSFIQALLNKQSCFSPHKHNTRFFSFTETMEDIPYWLSTSVHIQAFYCRLRSHILSTFCNCHCTICKQFMFWDFLLWKNIIWKYNSLTTQI